MTTTMVGTRVLATPPDPPFQQGGTGGVGASWPAMAGFLRTYGYPLLLAALVVVAVFLVGSLVVARRRGRVDRWVALVAGYAVLALSAEGMWGVARERLRLPTVLAAAVFFVAEATMVSSAMQAGRHYSATTVRDQETGRVLTPGHPGKHGRAVWIIACVAGVIVAGNSKNPVEVPLRLALPLAAAMLWWNALTADGSTPPQASSWRWTPRRFLLWVGALEAGERDMVAINRDRRVATMTVLAHRVHSAPAGSRARARAAARLRRLALVADEVMVGEVQRRVRLVHEVEALTAPTRPAGQPVPQVGRGAAATRDGRSAPGNGRATGPRKAPRPDAELLAELTRMPAPVTVSAAMRELGVGGARARRLMARAGLLPAQARGGAGPDQTTGPDAETSEPVEGGRALHVVHGAPQTRTER
ncbi:MAG: hypothetical protein HYR62_05985 [Actinobacteria bacterium]|nr:hypothetical protein [Actinomycetota bacterium]